MVSARAVTASGASAPDGAASTTAVPSSVGAPLKLSSRKAITWAPVSSPLTASTTASIAAPASPKTPPNKPPPTTRAPFPSSSPVSDRYSIPTPGICCSGLITSSTSENSNPSSPNIYSEKSRPSCAPSTSCSPGPEFANLLFATSLVRPATLPGEFCRQSAPIDMFVLLLPHTLQKECQTGTYLSYCYI